MGIKIERFVVGIGSTNCYLVVNEETKSAVLIDVADHTKKIVAYLNSNNFHLEAILITHGHFDHILGLPEIQATFGSDKKVPVYIHEEDLYKLTDAKANHSKSFTKGFTYEDAEVNAVKDGDILMLAGVSFEVFFTPGHTKGGCCYYLRNENTVFAGDTLFRGTVGRCDFEDGDLGMIKKSIKEKLLVLPKETIVYPGHDAATTIGYESLYNPYVNEEDSWE
jgi:glyoxylase-like metal-dependent hydrolase (beta-lactamase superfamily II)